MARRPRPASPLPKKDLQTAIAAWAGVCLLTFLVHLPAVGHGFVNWDDDAYVVDNAGLRLAGSSLFGWAFSAFRSNNWHPLTWLSHALDYRLWGLDAGGHHLGNVLLHAANTFLVAVLLFVLVRPRARFLIPTVVAALLFGLHPLHVESVAWVSERKDVLSAFFSLLSVIFYVRYAGRAETASRAGFPAGSLAFFALALLSKPMAATLPLVLLLLDLFPLRRIPGAATPLVVAEKVPFFALSAVSAGLTLLAQARGGAMGTLEAYPASTRLLVALRAVGFYVAKMLVPVDLSPLYPYPGRGEASLASFEYLASAAFVLGASALSFHLWRRGRPVFLVAWLSYLVMLAPVLGLVHFGPQAAADRYTYTTLIPFFFLAGLAFDRLVGGSRATTWITAALLASAAALAFVLCLLTVRQSRVWRDSVTLWSHVLALHPGSALAYNRRGDAYLSLGSDALALADLSRSIELSEGAFEPSLFRRAGILLRRGRPDEARRDIDAAIGVRPDRSDSYNVRGACHAARGEWDEAIADFSRAIELDPRAPEAYNNRGSALRSRGDLERARSDFDRALELDPGNADAYHNRGMLRASRGELDPALSDLTRAIELRGDFAEALLNRCELQRQRGRLEAALVDCTRGVDLDGESAPAHNLRGLVLLRLGRHAEARSAFDRALEIAPDYAEAYVGRGIARYSSGDRAGARADFGAATRLGDEEIRLRVEKLGILR
jgi:protein O-mannosyl-transferase